MLDAFIQLSFFTAKVFIVMIVILLLLAGILALIGRHKHKANGSIIIENLNEKYKKMKQHLSEVLLKPKEFKKYLKVQKSIDKKDQAMPSDKKNIFVIHFDGDMKASAVTGLREEVTAILTVAKSTDEVVVCIESGGGVVHGYGLAAAQLLRIRDKGLHLTAIVDKVAASGGYLMAVVAHKIIAAPFAIIGSIGVIVQLPNFHRLLKDKHIDFEQITAGSFKRTLTLFGQNTEEGREKLHQEIEAIHGLFKNLVYEYRTHLDIEKVATGEHWLGKQALALNLVDELNTSDDYLYVIHYLLHEDRNIIHPNCQKDIDL